MVYKASLLCSTFISGPDHIWDQEARKVEQPERTKIQITALQRQSYRDSLRDISIEIVYRDKTRTMLSKKVTTCHVWLFN